MQLSAVYIVSLSIFDRTLSSEHKRRETCCIISSGIKVDSMSDKPMMYMQS